MRWKRSWPILAALLWLGTSAHAGWVGDCGTVALSFAPDSVVAFRTADTADGPVVVEIHALLTDVPAVTARGRRLDWVGGAEMRLAADVPGVRVLEKRYPTHVVDMARDDPAACLMASTPGWEPHDGQVELIAWRVLVPQGTGRVAFSLADDGAPSVSRTPGLEGYPARVVWAGSAARGHEAILATACDRGAVLNPGPGEAVPERHCGGRSWQAMGVLSPAGD